MSVLGMRLLILFVSVVVTGVFYLLKRRDKRIDEAEEKLSGLELDLVNTRQDLDIVKRDLSLETKAIKKDLKEKVHKADVLTEKSLKEIIKNEFVSFENRLLKKGFKL